MDGPIIGGPSIKPIEPRLSIRSSRRDAARRVQSMVNTRDVADAMPSIVGTTNHIAISSVLKTACGSYNEWLFLLVRLRA